MNMLKLISAIALSAAVLGSTASLADPRQGVESQRRSPANDFR